MPPPEHVQVIVEALSDHVQGGQDEALKAAYEVMSALHAADYELIGGELDD